MMSKIAVYDDLIRHYDHFCNQNSTKGKLLNRMFLSSQCDSGGSSLFGIYCITYITMHDFFQNFWSLSITKKSADRSGKVPKLSVNGFLMKLE